MDYARQYIYIQVHTGLTADDGFNTMHPKVLYSRIATPTALHALQADVCIYRQEVHDRMLK